MFSFSPRYSYFSESLRSMILRGVNFFTLKYEYLGENETEFENILTHGSEAEAGSNDEKN